MTSVDFVKLFDKYVEFLRYENGKLSKFWLAYLDMVYIPLRLLRASWEGNWELYVSAIRSMIQWCFQKWTTQDIYSPIYQKCLTLERRIQMF